MLDAQARVEYREATAVLDGLVGDDIAALLAGVDLGDPPAVQAVLDGALPALVAQYGDVAATIALQFYRLAREDEGPVKRFRPVMAPVAPRAVVLASSRWATKPLWTPQGSQTPLSLVQSRVEGSMTRHVRNVGRDTVARNADAEGARWCRVPRSGSCDFCVMVSSRGAVYRSSRSAGEANSYHDHCHCTPERIGRGEPLPYDADALYEQYRANQRARRTAA